MASALSFTSFSVTEVPKESQLFQPRGGVDARTGAAAAWVGGGGVRLQPHVRQRSTAMSAQVTWPTILLLSGKPGTVYSNAIFRGREIWIEKGVRPEWRLVKRSADHLLVPPNQ